MLPIVSNLHKYISFELMGRETVAFIFGRLDSVRFFEDRRRRRCEILKDFSDEFIDHKPQSAEAKF